MNKHQLLRNCQFGFRKERLATDLHLLMTSAWGEAVDHDLSTCIIALDTVGAFDRVWHSAMLEKLRAVGVEGQLLVPLRDYLGNRQLSVVYNNKRTSQKATGVSLPQGTVFGPLMWNIFINDLLNLVPEAQAFADDMTLSISYEARNEPVTVSKISSRLKNIIAWGNRCQVKFASRKTHLMLVTRMQPTTRIYVDNKLLNPQHETDVVGVTSDRKLTFNTHIENIAKKNFVLPGQPRERNAF